MSSTRIFLLVTVLALSLAGDSFAQSWTAVQQFPGYLSFVKFIDARVGFVGLGVGPGGPLHGPVGIWRSTDGGDHWIECTIPTGYTGEVTDLVMTDAAHGWATVIPSGGIGRNGLWQTSDSGRSWNETGLMGACTSIRITPSAMVLTDIFNNGHTSTDGGITFFDGVGGSSNCVDFVDPVHGVSSNYRGNQWETTADGGLTWQPTSQFVESWSVYGVPGTSVFYAAPEGPTDGSPYTSQVFRSSDYGQHWSAQSKLPFTTTGTIVGVGEDELYIQVSNNAGGNVLRRDGIFRSTDHGVTWTDLGGPGALSDSRFTTVNTCSGNVVFAFDSADHGTLYRLGVPGSNMYFASYYAGIYNITLDTDVTVPLSVRLPDVYRAGSRIGRRIQYSISFDSTVTTVAGVTAPAGWKLAGYSAKSNSVDVTLSKSNNSTFSDSLGIGAITLHTQKSGLSTVVIRNLRLETDSETVNFCLVLEGNVTAVINADARLAVASQEVELGVPLRLSTGQILHTSLSAGRIELQVMDETGRTVDATILDASQDGATYSPDRPLHGPYFLLLRQGDRTDLEKLVLP